MHTPRSMLAPEIMEMKSKTDSQQVSMFQSQMNSTAQYRDSKLFRKRKRTDSMSNLMPGTSRQALLPNPPKQPNLQMHPPTDLLQALTGLINTFSKNGPEQQGQQHQLQYQPQQRQQHQLQYQPQLQQSSRGKGPANGRGFPRKGAPPSGQ